jgi:hypothetical protein
MFTEFSLQKAQFLNLNLQSLANHQQVKVSLNHYAKSGE